MLWNLGDKNLYTDFILFIGIKFLRIIPFNLVEMFAATSCPNYIVVAFRRRHFLLNGFPPFRRRKAGDGISSQDLKEIIPLFFCY